MDVKCIKKLLVLLLITVQIQAEERKPNFIIILTDDQGYGDLGCFGGQHVSTPHIDQMAREGVRLTSFYVAGPVCTPSRAALMTGCYPRRVGLPYVLLADSPTGLNPNETTVAKVLKKADYATALIGKWHLGDRADFSPLHHGFDHFWGIPYSHDIHPYNPLQERFQFPPLPLYDGNQIIETEPDADYLTQRVTEQAIKFIEGNADNPFFLYLAHPMPHAPIHASPQFMKGADEGVLDTLSQEDGTINYPVRDQLLRQCLEEVDWSVGQVLETLKRLDIDEDTFVIFFSDNGPGRAGSAGPLKGKKGSAYEGGTRVATVARWPGHIPAGGDNNELLSAMDLLPTFANLANSPLPEQKIDGLDISQTLLANAPSPRDVLYYHSTKTLCAVRDHQWKLHLGNARKNIGPQELTLYDLTQDIGETKNVIDAHPEVAARLHKAAIKMNIELIEEARPVGKVGR